MQPAAQVETPAPLRFQIQWWQREAAPELGRSRALAVAMAWVPD
jgi:hypothetical protein